MLENQTVAPVAKKTFSLSGMALLAAAASTVVIQVALAVTAELLATSRAALLETSWFLWVYTFVPLYAVGIPLALLIMRTLPVPEQGQGKLGRKNFFLFLLMCFPVMYGGSLLGTLLSSLLSGGMASNRLFAYVFDDSPLKVLIAVVLAPVLEEYLFRKQLLDRCAQYGEKPAILFSALAFGLFHMNLYQFFYAAGLGLIFAYMYIRTRRLRYSVSLHMVINFMSSALMPLLLSAIDTEGRERLVSGRMEPAALSAMLPGLTGFLLYAVALLGLSVAGLIVLVTKAPKLVFLPAAKELPKEERFKAVYCNAGVILFFLFCVAASVLSLVL